MQHKCYLNYDTIAVIATTDIGPKWRLRTTPSTRADRYLLRQYLRGIVSQDYNSTSFITCWFQKTMA